MTLSRPPGKRVKLPGCDRSDGSGVLCPGVAVRQPAQHPQLKHEPLGCSAAAPPT